MGFESFRCGSLFKTLGFFGFRVGVLHAAFISRPPRPNPRFRLPGRLRLHATFPLLELPLRLSVLVFFFLRWLASRRLSLRMPPPAQLKVAWLRSLLCLHATFPLPEPPLQQLFYACKFHWC